MPYAYVSSVGWLALILGFAMASAHLSNSKSDFQVAVCSGREYDIVRHTDMCGWKRGWALHIGLGSKPAASGHFHSHRTEVDDTHLGGTVLDSATGRVGRSSLAPAQDWGRILDGP